MINPFNDWDVGQRYANQNHFNQARVDAHRLGAGASGGVSQESRCRGVAMITFDQVIPLVRDVLRPHQLWRPLSRLLSIATSMAGCVLLFLRVSRTIQSNWRLSGTIAAELCPQLGSRSYSPERTVLFEEDIDSVKREAPSFPLEGFDNLFVVDRLVSETDWASISEESTGAPRVVFFSIKGGVGRSTALAATAWALAQAGKREPVLDLDLESPGQSTALLPAARQPVYGITDWLVEDLLDNGDTVLMQWFQPAGFPTMVKFMLCPPMVPSRGNMFQNLGESGCRRLVPMALGRVGPSV